MFKWLSVSLIAKSVFVPAQLFVSVALIGSHIAMFGFFIYAIAFVYNKYNDFLQLLSDMTSQSGLLATVIQILQSMGVINAFNDVFSIFSPFILGYLAFKILGLVFASFQATSNELFKVGVLTQQ